MSKTILILADGMADNPLPELGGKTPVEYADTPNFDAIARDGACGTFLTLPAGYPTSSDVANMSVLGYDVARYYSGRGPLEALSQGLELGPRDIAWRCNLITERDGILTDYSGGHISNDDARRIMLDLAAEFNCAEFSFHPGVSYRNLLILHGDQFTEQVEYEKPDASQDQPIAKLGLRPVAGAAHSAFTAEYVNALRERTYPFLAAHPVNRGRASPANMIWPWSPGRKPAMPPFREKYGLRGAVISAVDVIFGLGTAAGMDLIRVPGATGYIDTNYEGKADAAVQALADHDFVYVHVEAVDEVSHAGDLALKVKTIEDLDHRLVGRLRAQLQGQPITYVLLPDHPVPVKLRYHTRDPVPVAICGPHLVPDACQYYSERLAPTGSLGFMQGEQLLRRAFG